MVEIRSDTRIFICGKTGSGKTFFVKNKLWPRFKKKIFHDPKIENADLLDTHSLATNPHELLKLLQMGKSSILYQPADLCKSDFNTVCEITYKWGNIVLLEDEASFYSDSHSIEKWHKEILVRGRTRNVGMVNLTQRPKEISNFLISESDHQFVFKLTLDTDIAKLKSMIPRKYHQLMYELKPYYFIHNDTNGNAFAQKPIKSLTHK